jgi:hypothetical protein
MHAEKSCPAGGNGGAGGHALCGVVVQPDYTATCPAGQSPDPRLRALDYGAWWQARRRYLLAPAGLRQEVRDGN